MGHLDSSLTEEGLAQAKKLGERLKNIKIDAVFSSDLERAYRTACIICKELNPRLIPKATEKLREINVGRCAGIKKSLLMEKYPESRNIDFHFPEGESYKQFCERIVRFIASLEEKHSNRSILVVAHEGVIKAVECASGSFDFEAHCKVKISHEYLEKFIVNMGTLTKIR